jgi:MFS family permease
MSRHRQRVHLRRNYLLHALDGGVFMGTVALVNRTTTLPAIVKWLGGSGWMIALMPVLGPAAMMLPPLLTAHRVQRLLLFKPLLLITGLFQRLPYLLAGLLLFWAGQVPDIALAAVVLAPLVSGLSAGISIAAWQQLVAKTIPSERRASMHAMRNVLAAGLGLLAGWVTKEVMARRPGPSGYAWLHLVAFGGLMVSYVLFAMIREWAHRPRREERQVTSLVENLRQSRRVLSARQLTLYLLSISTMNGIFLAMGFLPLRALETSGAPDELVGSLTICQMAGGIFGNLLSGYLGDRKGLKVVMLLARGSFLLVFGLAMIAESAWAWKGLFGLFGLAMGAHMVSKSAMPLELCPAKRRSTVLAVIALVQVPTLLLASLMGGWAKDANWLTFDGLAWIAIGLVAASIIPALVLPEPRKASSAAQEQGAH